MSFSVLFYYKQRPYKAPHTTVFVQVQVLSRSLLMDSTFPWAGGRTKMAASAAALLDELMGRDRNLAPTEKRREIKYDDPEVPRNIKFLYSLKLYLYSLLNTYFNCVQSTRHSFESELALWSFDLVFHIRMFPEVCGRVRSPELPSLSHSPVLRKCWRPVWPSQTRPLIDSCDPSHDLASLSLSRPSHYWISEWTGTM